VCSSDLDEISRYDIAIDTDRIKYVTEAGTYEIDTKVALAKGYVQKKNGETKFVIPFARGIWTLNGKPFYGKDKQ
jgi:hypothetical protein